MSQPQATAIPEELSQWPGHIGNWHRWPNDRGTLNLLGPDSVLRGMAEVKMAKTIPCTRAVDGADPLRSTPAASIRMIPSLCKPEDKHQSWGDEFHFRTHGVTNTHIDAFSHVGFGGWSFNGARFDEVISMEDGARRFDVTNHGPIVTRGIFVDVPVKRGNRWLEAGDAVLPADIAEEVEKVEPGDAFVIRTGSTLQRGIAPDATSGHHGTLAGVHWDCLEMLAKKDISVFAVDCGADFYPGPDDKPSRSPIHILCLVMYGIPIIHNMDLEELGAACDEFGRDSFMFVATPLRIPRATGSPIAPVAIL